MRPLEVTCTLPDGSRNRNLTGFRKEKQPITNVPQAHRIICVFRQDIRQQLRHELLHGVRVTVDQGAYTEDSGVPLSNSQIVFHRLAIRRNRRLAQ